MNKEIVELIHDLRQAAYEALANSWSVAQAMAELERQGHCPTLLVDASLVDEFPPPQDEETKFGDRFVLSDHDRQFLKAIKVASPV